MEPLFTPETIRRVKTSALREFNLYAKFDGRAEDSQEVIQKKIRNALKKINRVNPSMAGAQHTTVTQLNLLSEIFAHDHFQEVYNDSGILPIMLAFSDMGLMCDVFPSEEEVRTLFDVEVTLPATETVLKHLYTIKTEIPWLDVKTGSHGNIEVHAETAYEYNFVAALGEKIMKEKKGKLTQEGDILAAMVGADARIAASNSTETTGLGNEDGTEMSPMEDQQANNGAPEAALMDIADSDKDSTATSTEKRSQESNHSLPKLSRKDRRNKQSDNKPYPSSGKIMKEANAALNESAQLLREKAKALSTEMKHHKQILVEKKKRLKEKCQENERLRRQMERSIKEEDAVRKEHEEAFNQVNVCKEGLLRNEKFIQTIENMIK